MKLVERIRGRKDEEARGAEPALGTGTVAERIAAAEALARSANFHVPIEARDREQQAAALAVPGDGSVPRRLVSAFDNETDREVREGIFKALFELFIDADEREKLAAIRGLQLTAEDVATLTFLRTELPRLVEAAQEAT
ncbi:MAG TPA: hypothetical protein VFJ17_12445 [Mycobacteriales bacterium]|jgi:hypothetical protein|nr:hypothetical protein [Mycobacteriales bacterium]